MGLIMKLHFQTSGASFPDQIPDIKIRTSRASESSVNFANERQIQKLDQQGVINDYFSIFDETHTDIEIKNLIAARLQPSYQLPQIHDMKVLSQKANELLKFSLSI